MADFTGILGSKNAQPGTLVPGQGPAGVSHSDTILVSQSISLFVEQGKWKRLEEFLTVTDTIGHSSSIAKSLTSSITITPTVVGLPQPYARFTQDVLEAVYSTVGYARVTQDILEIVYKKANTQSVSHTITITPTLLRKGDNSQLVTQTITIAQSVSERDNHIRQNVSDTVTVNQTIKRAGTNNQSITQTVNVGSSNVVNSDHRHSITHAITVTSSLAQRSTISHQSVEDGLLVTSTIADTTNSVSETPNHEISVSQTVGFEIDTATGRSVEMSVSHTIAVSQTCAGRNTVNRQSVTTSISVSEMEEERDPTQHISSSVDVTQAVVFFVLTTHGIVADVILVTQTIAARNTVIRLAVGQTINVTSTIGMSNTIVEATIFHGLFVTPSISFQRNDETVTDTITVTTAVRTNKPTQSVGDTITISDSIVQGSSNRVITATDTITITAMAGSRISPNRQTVTHSIRIRLTNFGQGPIVEQSVEDLIGVTTLAVNNPFTPQNLSTRITITPTIIARCESNRQGVTHNLTLTTALRSSPHRVTVTDTLTVTPRLAIFDWTVKHNLHVAQIYGRIYDKSITDSVTVESVLNRQIIAGRHIIDRLPITDTTIRKAIWYRTITQVLIIPDDSYLKQFSFWPTPIVLPVVTGTRVTNEVKLSSKLDEIKLPAALLGDETGNVDEITIQRSMNSRTLVIIKSSDRQRLKLSFRVQTAKFYEMMIFVKKNMSELIKLTDWNGQIWIGRFTSNPFDTTNAGRWATVKEFVTFEIEFEGTKTGG